MHECRREVQTLEIARMREEVHQEPVDRYHIEHALGPPSPNTCTHNQEMLEDLRIDHLQ